jgi:flagellar protein FliL
MARKKTDAEVVEGEEGGKKKRSKAKLIPAVVVGLGLLGGGYFMGPGKSTDVAAGGPTTTTTTTTIPGPVVSLEPITLNIPGNHYLKVGLALQMAGPKEGEKAPPPAEDVDPKVAHAPVLDAAIDVLGGRSYEELVTPPGREAAKQALVDRMKERYAGKLEGIYFTEFVLQ